MFASYTRIKHPGISNAPRWDDETFIRKIISLLPDLTFYHLILGGDLNCTINPLLDKSYMQQDSPSKMAKSIGSFMDQIGGENPWRFFNPDKKQFSFYSQIYKTFSRIDYLYIDNYFLPAVDNIEYSMIVVSDHAMSDHFYSTFHSHFYKKTRPPWRLNCTLLNDDDLPNNLQSN